MLFGKRGFVQLPITPTAFVHAMLSTGPEPLAPAGATNVVCGELQFGAPAPHAAVTPLWLIKRLEPEFEAILVATIAPTGAPAQPRSPEPAVQMFGRWLVSEPSAGKADPEKAPSPVETG